MDFLEVVELVLSNGVLVSVLGGTCLAVSDVHVSEHGICPHSIASPSTLWVIYRCVGARAHLCCFGGVG